MSIHTSVNFDNYYMNNQQPEWMRSERLDYCEPMKRNEPKTFIEKIVAFFF